MDTYVGPYVLANFEPIKEIDTYYACEKDNTHTYYEEVNFCKKCGSRAIKLTKESDRYTSPFNWFEITESEAFFLQIQTRSSHSLLPNRSWGCSRKTSFYGVGEEDGNIAINISKKDIEQEIKAFKTFSASELELLHKFYTSFKVQWGVVYYRFYD